MISIVGVVISCYQIFSMKQSYIQSQKKYEAISNIYTHTDGEVEHKEDAEKHTRLKELNDDYLGWISIDNTNINYPIVQTDNNDFYLNHDFHQAYDIVGSIFMDYRNAADFQDKNIIIYGHNMKDDSMFSHLRKYLDEDFFQKNKEVTLDILGEQYTAEIFAAYETREVDWMEIDFTDEGSFEDFASDMLKKSVHPSEATWESDDQMITLATCTGNIRDERMVVHAKLKKGIE